MPYIDQDSNVHVDQIVNSNIEFRGKWLPVEIDDDDNDEESDLDE